MAGTNTDITLSGKFISEWHSIPEKKWLLLISVVVFIANAQIYWINTLFQDDLELYYKWNRGDFSIGNRLGSAYINVLLTWIASKIDFFLARSLVLLGVWIPAILLLFRILRKLEYPLPVALFSAGLIGFSPGQVEISFFVNGSYHAEALFIMLIAFWVGFHFLEDSNKYKWGWYLFAISLFYWALKVSELIVPTGIAFIFCCFCSRNVGKKAWLLWASFSLLTLYHVYFNILQNGRSAVKQAKPLTYEAFSNVFQKFMIWCFPTPYLPEIDTYDLAIFMAIICSLCVVIGIARGFVPETEPFVRRKSIDRRWAFIWRIMFPVMLCLSVLLIMTVSPWFRPRHALFPAIGLYIFISFSLYEAFKKYKYGKTFIIIILIWLTTGSILRHYGNISDLYSPVNRMHEDFISVAMTTKYPPQSQIVVVNMNPQTEGFWYWSTGYLQSALNRDDITGLVGNELMFINPFIPANWKEGGMNGLNNYNPLFLYRRSANGFDQLTYFLQWTENDINSDFVLYQTDPATGKISKLLEGKGMEDYIKAVSVLAKRGVNRSDIMWGGESSDRDKQRLGAGNVPKEKGEIRGKGVPQELVKAKGFEVFGGTVENGGIGYILSAPERDKVAVALKKTDSSFKNGVSIKCKMKAALPGGTRNGYIVFGENPQRIGLAGIRIGAMKYVIEGYYGLEKEVSQKFDPNKIFDVELAVNIKEKSIVLKIDGTEIKSKMKYRPTAIDFVGFAAANTKTEFSELQVTGN